MFALPSACQGSVLEPVHVAFHNPGQARLESAEQVVMTPLKRRDAKRAAGELRQRVMTDWLTPVHEDRNPVARKNPTNRCMVDVQRSHEHSDIPEAGSALADDPQGKVYIPEKNLFRLAVLSHAATGTVLCRLTRKAPKELYGTNFAELTEGQTEAIPADCQLTPGSDYIALQDQEAFRFISYCGDPVAIRHRPAPLEINLSIQGDAAKADKIEEEKRHEIARQREKEESERQRIRST